MADIGDAWTDPKGGAGSNKFYCIVGDTLEICHSEYFKGKLQGNNSDSTRNGFRLIFPKLGKLIDSSNKKANCVDYLHEKSGQQVIEFVEDVAQRRSYLVMETVAVHDHSTIAMGGPAFAAYYAGKPTEEGGS